MKRIIPILVFVLVCSFNINLNAQQGNDANHQHNQWCGTVTTQGQVDALDAFAEYYYHRGGKQAYASRPRALKFVPISYHMVRQTNGSYDYTLRDALNDLCVVNQDMSHADIQFYLKQHPTKGTMIDLGIKNDAWNNGSANTQNTLLPNFNNDQNAVNVYQVKTIYTTDPNFVVAGRANGSIFHFDNNISAPNAQSSCILIKKGSATDDKTLAHEFGHNFSLSHTFFGWEGQPDYDTNCGTPAPAWAEKFDGSNCSTSGDRLCDTSPDYLTGFSCGTNNPQFSACLLMDSDSATGNADGSNIMGYGFNCTNKAFTTDQINMMDYNLNTYRPSFIANTPTVTTITGAPTLDPADATFFDGVQLNWSAVTGATHYAVEVSLTSNFSPSLTHEMAVTTTTSFLAGTDGNFLTNRKYYWRVIPFNSTYFCASPSLVGEFTTSNIGVNTQTINEVNHISIRPNFTKSGQAVNLFVEASQAFDADVNIYNVQGQLVYQETQKTFDTGSLIYPIPTDNLAAGLYIVAVQTENGIVKEKLVITN